MLDEITVTAQRREQSLQDVPISIQTFDGREITRQGFISLSELAAFSPGLIVKDWSEEHGLIVRGAGTQSKNLGVEQGVPTFIDGVHFGRGSQVKNSYLDLEQIEVLKGPQPVFFGQNAAAGALNITTRKPTEEWEANLSAEAGNFGKVILEGGVGGPITDTLGIRVAAKYYDFEGFMTDFFTGRKFPERETKAGRVTLQWTPTESFEARLKVDYADNDLGPRVWPLVMDRFCCSPGDPLADGYTRPFLPHAERTPIIGISSTNTPGGIELGIGIGEFTDVGWVYGPTFVNPFDEVLASGIPLTEASGSDSGVVYSWNDCFAAGGLQVLGGGLDPDDPTANIAPVTDTGRQPMLPTQFESCNMEDVSESQPWHTILDLVYTFGNGIELASKTAFSKHRFHNTPHNSGGGAFATNPRQRGEDLDQVSQEIRLTSETGGAIEWMAEVYFQNNDLLAWSDAYRGNSRRSIRTLRAVEDSDWFSTFATVTFNFMEDKASLDIGGRYTDISKTARASNAPAEWFVVNEVRGGGDGSIVRVPYGLDATQGGSRGVASRDFLATYPGIVNGAIVGRSIISGNCDLLLGRNHPAGNVSSSRCADVTAPVEDDSFDPQVVFRYRPSDQTSWYFKYATSFKSGAYDMAVSEVTRFVEDFTFGPEEYEIIEVGVRSSLMDGRMSLEATAFTTDITGVQVTLIDRVLDRSITKNIAEQTSDGLELSLRYAASDRVTLSGYAAFLDATIVSFPDAVCSEDERLLGLCRGPNDPTGAEGTIDRSGQDPRNAPAWQFTGNLQWELPTFIAGYRSDLDVTLTATDDYITLREFTREIDMGQEEDLNVSFEIGPEDGNWTLLVYGRNLLEPTPRYNPERDGIGDGLLGSLAQVGAHNFASYGARFSINFD